ncbi:MAG: hypothetical protein EOP56_11550 [Sphingobacteriales bacterium]|nr:MAG: hypothetical protein EOP56_11550 [Sphingobacteriales bacterium]
MKKVILLFVLSFLVIEISGYVLALLRIEPTGYRLFFNKEWLDPKNAYADRDTTVGVWHSPNDTWIQNGPCFTAEMKSNAFGARDNNWESGKDGYLFLGSSFIEGYGVNYNERVSEHFEKLTGKEVFNCAMSGTFSPVQYYMTLVKFKNILKFDTAVVFFVLPNDEQLVTKLEKKRYRPYLINDSIVYTRSSKLFPDRKDKKEKLQLFVLQYSYVYHLFEYYKNRNMLKSRLMEDEKAEKKTRSYENLAKVMSKFCNDFPDKYFYFVLIPTLNDNSGAFPQPVHSNMRILDLRNSLDNTTDYFNCNTHWNEGGHYRVANALYKAMYPEKSTVISCR